MAHQNASKILIQIVINDEIKVWGRLCPALREATTYLQGTTQEEFVEAAVEMGINKATATIQFRKARAFWAGADAAEAIGPDALAEFLKNHKW